MVLRALARLRDPRRPFRTRRSWCALGDTEAVDTEAEYTEVARARDGRTCATDGTWGAHPWDKGRGGVADASGATNVLEAVAVGHPDRDTGRTVHAVEEGLAALSDSRCTDSRGDWREDKDNAGQQVVVAEAFRQRLQWKVYE